jgi:hypothetical protein
MDKMLSFEEKRFVNELFKDSEKTDPVMWPAWGYFVPYALGGFIIVYVCLATVSNLTELTIKFVLLPGILAGMTLLLGGSWIEYRTRNFQERRILISLLKKLLE